jgi:ParB-like chromosome segregation protein Spo0J
MSELGQPIHPEELKESPHSTCIFDADPDPALLASIADHGIQTPIVVAADGQTVVSGHRRRRAALKLGLTAMPVIIRSDIETDDQLRAAILESNVARIKTPEERAREYMARLPIEQHAAAERRREGVDSAAPKGDARDLAARYVGWSGRQAEKAARVVQAIDAAHDAGNSAFAAELRTKLKKSVDAAHRLICTDGMAHDWTTARCTKCGKPAPKKDCGTRLLQKLVGAVKDCDRLQADQPDPGYREVQELVVAAQQRLSAVLGDREQQRPELDLPENDA